MQPVDLPSGFQHARELLVERDLLLHGLGKPDDLFHGRPPIGFGPGPGSAGTGTATRAFDCDPT
jgi:hypothetical protein